jgi:intron-binding protein aquarius
VDQIYNTDIKGAGFSIKRVMMLEFSQYLENFLWPNYSADSGLAHLLSIVVVVNEKFRERVPAWTAFQQQPEHFEEFFHSALKWAVAEPVKITVQEQTKLLIFLDHCFTSMEVDLVRTQVQKLVSLPMWSCLLDARREAELKAIPKWKKFWKLLAKKDAKETPENLEKLHFERKFLSNMIQKFLKILYTIQEKECPEDVVDFVERFLILIIDLEALLPTRRFFNTVLDDSHLVVRASLAPLAQRPEGRLFTQLLEQVRFYTRFEINDQTGEPLSDKDMMGEHYARVSGLQRAVFVKYPELRSLALATIASIEDREQLEKHFLTLSRDTLYQVCQYLHLVA